MTSDSKLLQQAGTLQQPPLVKKKRNRSWRGFLILLIINNLLFVWLSPFIFLLPFAIIDLIAVKWYVKKQSPPWKTFVISLVVVNVINFLMLREAYIHSQIGEAAIALIPFILIILITYFIAILAYIYTHLTNARAKAIFYIVLASTVLLLALNTLLSVFYSARH